MFSFNYKKVNRLHKFKKENYKRMKPRQRKLYYAIHNWLKEDFNSKARREYVIAPYIIDIYLPKFGIAIELDGSFHDNRQEYDSKRDGYLENIGILTLRFDNSVVDEHFDEVVERVKRAVIKRNNISMENKVHNHNFNYYEGKKL